MIGPVASAIYVNQQTASVASNQGNQNAKTEFQNMIAGTLANEKEKEVQEVRPTEENHEVDPDREHQKNESDQEAKRDKNRQKNTNQQKTSIHKLDIKV